eukprot:GDKI01002183.1.p1 GENE.GDKI01002183.1~~GDKI01002183.1.p1  ORF type:complete len:108 (+),score=22.63 GDKI01002183.1:1-324(+)
MGGWAHLDLRWPNVVYLGGENWMVIDAEYARPFGSPMAALKPQDPDTETADEAADCYLVGCMMKAKVEIVRSDQSGAAEELQEALLQSGPARQARRARDLLQHTFFK